MKKTKIVHITQALGGVQTYLTHVLAYADRAQFDFTLIAPAQPDLETFCSTHHIEYRKLNLVRQINPFRDLLVLFKLMNHLRNIKPDLVHVHSAKAGFLGRLASKLTGNTVFYTPHGFSYLSFVGLKRMIFYILEYVARFWTDKLIAVSHTEANRARFELGFKKEKISVVLNSIPFTDALPDYSNKTKIRVGMIGRLTHQKNPLLFLEIADEMLKKFPTIEFVMLGAGMQDHLAKEITTYLTEHELLDRVQILGWGDSHTSSEFLKGLDIFLMTSVFEGLPYALLEAMRSGIPCVVTKADGNTDVIDNNENGYACITKDEFVSKVESLVLDKSLRNKIGTSGFKHVLKQHNLALNIKKLETLYHR